MADVEAVTVFLALFVLVLGLFGGAAPVEGASVAHYEAPSRWATTDLQVPTIWQATIAGKHPRIAKVRSGGALRPPGAGRTDPPAGADWSASWTGEAGDQMRVPTTARGPPARA